MDTVEYATFCYDTVEVENGLNVAAKNDNRELESQLVHICRKNRGWLLLADAIERILYLCKCNLMFVQYLCVFNIHSHTPGGENPRFSRQV